MASRMNRFPVWRLYSTLEQTGLAILYKYYIPILKYVGIAILEWYDVTILKETVIMILDRYKDTIFRGAGFTISIWSCVRIFD